MTTYLLLAGWTLLGCLMLRVVLRALRDAGWPEDEEREPRH